MELKVVLSIAWEEKLLYLGNRTKKEIVKLEKMSLNKTPWEKFSFLWNILLNSDLFGCVQI